MCACKRGARVPGTHSCKVYRFGNRTTTVQTRVESGFIDAGYLQAEDPKSKGPKILVLSKGTSLEDLVQAAPDIVVQAVYGYFYPLAISKHVDEFLCYGVGSVDILVEDVGRNDFVKHTTVFS